MMARRCLTLLFISLGTMGCPEPPPASDDVPCTAGCPDATTKPDAGCDLGVNPQFDIELRTAPDGNAIDVDPHGVCEEPTEWAAPEPDAAVNGNSVEIPNLTGELEPGDVVRLAYEVPGDGECRDVGFGTYAAVEPPDGGEQSSDGDGLIYVPPSEDVRWVVVEVHTADTRCQATYGVDVQNRYFEFRIP